MTPPMALEAEPALDGLLAQLVSGSLVLTDGQGAISKWSDAADLLFGRSAEEVLGRGFFETLIAAPLAPAGEGWRHFLEAGEAPAVRAKVELHALHASGHAFVVELVFIPVKLDEGFDFSLFLEDLAFALPPEQMVARLRAQHPVVVRALRTALADEVPPWEGWRTAGTLIAFRPLAATPWVEAELAARERAAAVELTEPDTEAEAETDPTEAIAGFADASQIVERLLGAVHKLDALEAASAELPRALQAAEARESRLLSELEARLSQLEWTSGSERERVGRLEAAGVSEALEARLAALEGVGPVVVDTSALEARLAALEGVVPVAVDTSALESRLAALESVEPRAIEPSGPDPVLLRRVDAGHAELRQLTERLARLEGPMARELREAVRTAVRTAQSAAEQAAPTEAALADAADELAVLRDRVDGHDERAAALATTVEAVQSLTADRAAGADGRFAELRTELTDVVATVESFRTGFDEARHAALAARRDAEQARTSAAAAGSATQRSAQQLSSAWRELLSPGGVGTGSGDRSIRTLPSHDLPPLPPARTPRDGFDDEAAPMAILALDGHFRELNPAFATLVGYPEHDFQKAVWPSAHDRGAYREQQEQLRLLAAGELESVGLRSTYMHGQGLMVPVTGRISAVRGEDGQPAHLLLRAEERASR